MPTDGSKVLGWSGDGRQGPFLDSDGSKILRIKLISVTLDPESSRQLGVSMPSMRTVSLGTDVGGWELASLPQDQMEEQKKHPV